jgi:uncharacterized membrane protein (UPF0127 family)
VAFRSTNRNDLYLNRKGHANEWEPKRLQSLGNYLVKMGLLPEAITSSSTHSIKSNLYETYDKNATLSINGINVNVEIANCPKSRRQGLMNRLSLDENTGMLFVFPNSQHRSFWMKETYLPLSIAYLNEEGTIINIEKMSPFDLSSVRSESPAKYALEMNEGWFVRNGIFIGDIINIQEKTMSESTIRKYLRELLKEMFVSHTDEPDVGDHIVNNNPNCMHFGSEGIVLSVNSLDGDRGKTISYECTNDGEEWDPGDVLEKTMDQLTLK